MATIARMAINLGWGGKSVERGLSRVTSLFGKFGEALKGANDIKSTFEMVRGVGRMFSYAPEQILKAGGDLQTMQIKMGLLTGSFDKGAASLENLRSITRDLGVPLEDVVGSFQKLSTAGVSTGDAEKLLRTFSTVSPLLGQGGLEQLAGGISEMARSGVADAQTLQQMQASGIKVYEALAQRLSVVQGRYVSVQEAIAGVDAKTVEASTAVLAMQDAVKTPEVVEAAQRFANSFDGQLSRLKQSAYELMRDVGKGLIDGLDIPAFLASLRGVLDAIASIVRTIVSSFAQIAGPQGDANRLEENFKAARNYGFSIAEVITKSANDFYTQFQSIFLGLESAAKKVVITFEQGVQGLWDGETAALIEARDFLDEIARGQNEKDRIARENEITKFFNIARANAAAEEKKKVFDFSLPKWMGGAFEPVKIAQKAMPLSDGLQQRVEAGTASAVEAIMRNNNRGGTDKAQEQIDATKDVGLKIMQVVQAVSGIRMPAVGVIPK